MKIHTHIHTHCQSARFFPLKDWYLVCWLYLGCVQACARLLSFGSTSPGFGRGGCHNMWHLDLMGCIILCLKVWMRQEWLFQQCAVHNLPACLDVLLHCQRVAAAGCNRCHCYKEYTLRSMCVHICMTDCCPG